MLATCNIQKCKSWLLDNVLHSSTRVVGLGKLLHALSGSFENAKEVQQRSREVAASPRRKRLHMLYLLNDILHHTKYHNSDRLDHDNVSSTLQKGIELIITDVALLDVAKRKKLHERFHRLLALWIENAYFEPAYLHRLREIYDNPIDDSSNVAEEGTAGQRDPNNTEKASFVAGRDAPFVMPASHGDPSTPFYDLPAGNMIRHIIPNRPEPINAKLMKPIQFAPGPADEGLTNVVKDFLAEADQIYTSVEPKDCALAAEADEMGQQVTYDELTKERIDDTYYGWSRAFCENMKKRRLKDAEPRRARSPSYSTSRSRSRSRSNSRNPPRRRGRRYSDTQSRGGGRSRSRSYSASPSRERSSRYHKREYSLDGSRSLSADGSRSRSPRNHNGRSYSRNRSPFRERSYSPMESIRTTSDVPYNGIPPSFHGQSQHFQQPQQPQQPLDPRTGLPVPNATSMTPPIMNKFPSNLAMGLNGVPFPPPPPPAFYNGIWPPPPPPLSGINTSMNSATQATPFQFGGLPPPPPPGQAVNFLAQFAGQNGGLGNLDGQNTRQRNRNGGSEP